MPDLYTEIIVPDGIGSLFLCICLSFSVSVLSLFFHLPLIFFFFFPLPLKQTLVGLGPSVSVLASNLTVQSDVIKVLIEQDKYASVTHFLKKNNTLQEKKFQVNNRERECS